MNTKKLTINFFSPYEAQQPIIKACLDDTIKFIIYNASRQSGKTLLSINMALYWALQNVDQHIMIVSPTDGQVKKIYRQMLKAIATSPFIYSNKSQAGDSEILLKNGSIILFRSAASTNSLRGYSNTHLILDECAFIDEDTYINILSPTLAVRGKKLLFCSTPKGTNFFYKLYMKGLEGNNSYKSFKTIYKDNPYANQEYIEEQKKMMPDTAFLQEYMGEFVDSGSLFKDIETIAITNNIQSPIAGETYFGGVDIAFKNDYTVFVLFNNKGEMVFMDRFTEVSNDELVRRIKATIDKFNPIKIFVEDNNQGLPILQQLVSKGAWKCEGFNTNQSTKPEIINKFIYAINNKEVKLLNDNNLIEEFKAFGYSRTRTGAIQFKANYGHDDIVMASAIAYYNYSNNKFAGQFIFS